MSNLKRHFEYFTQQEQPLKQRSRFWTWYMRGLHGDMDTRYDPVTGRRIRSPGPNRAARSGSLSRAPAATVLVPELSPASKELSRIAPRSSSVPPSASLRFKPLASDTYGYNPRGLVVGSRGAPILDSDKPWQDWSAPETVPSDSFESPATYVPRKRAVSPAPFSKPVAATSPAPAPIATPSYSVPRTQLRRLPLEAELDDLLGLKRPLFGPGRRSLANHLWRPSLFDDPWWDSPAAAIREPWWWRYPELRPIDYPFSSARGAPALRNSYLSPIKRTYLWGYHPMRHNGYWTVW